MVEGGTPNTLFTKGHKPELLQRGTDIVVTGYQSKDRLCEPTCRANGRDITSQMDEAFHGFLWNWSSKRRGRRYRAVASILPLKNPVLEEGPVFL